MKRHVFVAVTLASISGIAPARSTREENWQALSTTATAITGDIRLSPTRMVAAGHVIPLKVAADLPDYDSYVGHYPARVLKVLHPRSLTMLNGNSFDCSRPVRWIVVYRTKDPTGLGMEAFDSEQMPRSHRDPGFCASYSYIR